MQRLGTLLTMLGGSAAVTYWLTRYFAPRHSVLILEGRVVLITGASSGLGKALALAFAQRGARMVLSDYDADSLDALRREIEPYAPEVLVLEGDLTNAEYQAHLIQQTLENFGQIDVLVNNAEIQHEEFIHSQSGEMLHTMVQTNLSAAMQLTQQIIPQMLVQRHGFIVNMGGLLLTNSQVSASAYHATKGGLTAFSRALRQELKGTGIQVSLVQSLTPIQQPELAADEIVNELVQGKREILLTGGKRFIRNWDFLLRPV